MDQPDRPHRRRRLAIAGTALIATLGIAVPAAFAATGGGGEGSTTPSQTQPQTPQQPGQQQAPGQQEAPDQGGDRGSWGDHSGPCPEKDGNGDRGGSGPSSSGSSSDAPSAAPQSTGVASF